jgi:FkbM family methyltransferase
MITTREEKDKTLGLPLEILNDLVDVFGPDGPARIADIGACDCLSSIKYVMTFPKTFVMAFEPRQDNCTEASVNVGLYGMIGQVTILKYALGDRDQKGVTFYQSFGQAEWVKNNDTGNKSSSLLPPKEHLKEHLWCKFKESKCDMVTLDSFHFKPFDFIHIDVQGAELQVFKGAEEALKSVRAIWCEVSNVELYQGQPMKGEVETFLECRGFRKTKDTCGNKKFGDCFFRR